MRFCVFCEKIVDSVKRWLQFDSNQWLVKKKEVAAFLRGDLLGWIMGYQGVPRSIRYQKIDFWPLHDHTKHFSQKFFSTKFWCQILKEILKESLKGSLRNSLRISSKMTFQLFLKKCSKCDAISKKLSGGPRIWYFNSLKLKGQLHTTHSYVF